MTQSDNLKSMGLKATGPRIKILELFQKAQEKDDTRHLFESGKAVFELDGGGHHDHLVCLQCGHVEEFFDEEIEKRQARIAKQHGFVVRDHALMLYVDCQKTDCPHRKAR